jgi:ATP-dependent Clp protease ATP-binding subunit ClpA
MFERFTPNARAIVVAAQHQARLLGHRWIGCEHLLLAVAATDDETGAVLRAAGVTPDGVRAEIQRMIGPGGDASDSLFDTLDRDALAAIGIDLDVVRGKVEEMFGPNALRPPCRPERRRWRRPRAGRRPRKSSGHIPFTPRAKKCLEQSLREATELHSGYLGVEHLALALLATKSSTTAHILSVLDVSVPSLRAGILDRHRQAS